MSALKIQSPQAKVTLLRSSTYKKSLWKNGQGKTSEIAIEPPGASLENGDFLWRLSSAEIATGTEFSIFEKCDRLLTVLSGTGIVVNENPLKPLEVIAFSGEVKTRCQLVQDQVVDLGLIYKRDLISAKMSVKTFCASDEYHNLNLTQGVHLLFCVNGSFTLNGLAISANDTLHIEGPFEAKVELQRPATYVHIKISQLSHKPAFCSVNSNV